MQDHVIAGTMMMVRGTFYEKTDYQNLVVNGLQKFFGGKRIKFVPPAIFKPRQLWTGKQVITTIILNLCNGVGPNYIGLCKMKDDEFRTKGKTCRWKNGNGKSGCSLSETEFICRRGYLVSGYFDKNQISAAKYSILAAIEELFGGPIAASFITALTMLLTHYLKSYRGFTLSIRDVVTKSSIMAKRSKIVATAKDKGLTDLVSHFKISEYDDKGAYIGSCDEQVRQKLREAHLVGQNVEQKEIDAVSKKAANSVTENIHRLCEKSLEVLFPDNNLEMLIATGAKGSKANLLNMCSNLGQVEFDGKRPPLMPSGRTLPCFKPYEHSIRAGAFISNRYSSGGLRPQEMFFHTMAGRDGLIDTACKTASSGYLQRCLIKHLEGITISYDRTVRDHDQSVIQFQFGGDGLDVAKTPYLVKREFPFIEQNFEIYKNKLWQRGKPEMSEDVQMCEKALIKYCRKAEKNAWAEPTVGGIERVLGFNDFLRGHEKLKSILEVAKEYDGDEKRNILGQYKDCAIATWHQVCHVNLI